MTVAIGGEVEAEAADPALVDRIGPWLPLAFVVAVPLLLWFGRDDWFFLDEWELLVNRELREPSSLLRAHNGHWVALPTVAYRLWFQVFGIRSYLPYQVLSVTAHVGVAVLAVVFARRLGVRAWLAAVVVAPFVLFGAGRQNIYFGFTVNLTWAFLLGGAQLLLADHPGRFGRRDALGIACGVGALLCSAVGVAFAVGVGASTLVSRGWRVAVAHVAPLAALFLLWFATHHDDDSSEPQDLSYGTDVVRFVAELVRLTFLRLGDVAVAGLVLGAVAAGGLVVGARAAWQRHDRRWLGLAAGLLLALAVFALTSGAARVAVYGVEAAAAERYLHIGAALLLPFVAVGAELLARWKPVAVLVAIVPLAVGLPANVDLLREPRPFESDNEALIVALARSPQLAGAPADQRIAATFAPEFGPTVAWLRVAEREGRLPSPAIPPEVALLADATLAVHQAEGGERPGCTAVPLLAVDLHPGDEVLFRGVVEVRAVDGATRSYPLTFDAADGAVLRSTGSLPVEITGVGEGGALDCAVR